MCNVFKLFSIILVYLPNWSIVVKIISCKNIHNMFNASYAFIFGIHGVTGLVMVYFLSEIIETTFCNDEPPNLKTQKYNFAKYLESWHLLWESFRIIADCILFRFFYVVYADGGLVVNGKPNTKLSKICFAIYILFFTSSNFLSMRINLMARYSYPANSPFGWICLRLR